MFTRTNPPTRAVCRAIVTGLLLFVAPSALADGGPGRLLPPLIQYLAISGGMAQAKMRDAHLDVPSKPPPVSGMSIIPPRVEIPDLYEIDLVADPPRFTEPVDRDNMVSFDVLGGPEKNWTLTIRYDNEHKEIGDGSELLRFRFEYRF
jgi:hypothetical protein